MISFIEYKNFLKNIYYKGCNSEEQNEYINAHASRIYDIFQTITELHLNSDSVILDIGAKPYLLAASVFKFIKINFVGLGYSISEIRNDNIKTDIENREENSIKGEILLKSEQEKFNLLMWQCNIEKDKLPFKDNSIDLICFNETLEHLLFDPAFALYEMNRVLKTNGKIIFSSPNQLHIIRLLKMILGENVDDAYSIHGPYGRHNRNFTLNEIIKFFNIHGFSINTISSKTYLAINTKFSQKLITKIINLLLFWNKNRRGKTVTALITKKKNINLPIRPNWLYH